MSTPATTGDGEPGRAAQYSPGYYGAFLLDPDGNSAEAIHAGEPRTGDNSSTTFGSASPTSCVETVLRRAIAPVSGFQIAPDRPEQGRFHVFGGGRSFGLVHDGRPATETCISRSQRAGQRDGRRAPPRSDGRRLPGQRPAGERAVYHEGYYGAFVLDPDGNNVEAVCHNRRG